MLTLPHFHTKLRKPLEEADNIEHCLAEYLFPDTEFALGVVYPEGTQAEDLTVYEDKSLQFSSGERMYFADENVGKKLYPKPSDRAAYGNLPFTPCQSVKEIQAKILIVDDQTGENGHFFGKDTAKKWFGDCFGRISKHLCDELTGQAGRPFQFRLGIKPQQECSVYRIAKGTLAPTVLETLIPDSKVEQEKNEQGQILIKKGIDVVLPTSSFKGRKGEEAIAPGIYDLTLGIGVKTLARYRPHSLGTQFLVNYPRGVKKDILPILQEQAEQLMQAQQNVYGLAKYYVETYEQQQVLRQQPGEGTESWEALFEKAFSKAPIEQQEHMLLYRLLKTDLEHHCQLLEHPKIIDQLQQFLRQRWLDIATGRSIKFHSGLAQPSLQLAENEVWVPFLPDGEEIVVSRSPLLNSNGVIVLTNRRIIDSTAKEGTVYIHPDTAAKHLQGDFDGDFLFFASAKEYPTLTTEIKEALEPTQRYPNIIKQEKEPYYGTFPEIACHAQQNSIGLIANQIQRVIALRWEAAFLEPEQRSDYLQQLKEHYRRLNSKTLPEQWQPMWQELCQLPDTMTTKEEEAALDVFQWVLFNVIGTLSNQLQIATDSPKSMARPDDTVLAYCQHLSGYREMNWIKEKKRADAYAPNPIKTGNNSPVDWMIDQTNECYHNCVLQSQPLVAFRDLFKSVNYNSYHQDVAALIKERYNNYAAQASKLAAQAKNNDKPTLAVTSSTSGKSIVIEDILAHAQHNQPIWQEQTLHIHLVSHPRFQNKLQAIALSEEGKRLYTIGNVSYRSQQYHRLESGLTLKAAKIEINKGVTQSEIDAAWQKLADYVEFVRQQTTDKDRLGVAAALWHLSHPRKQDGLSGKASAAMAIFPEQILERLQERQMDIVKVVGIHHDSNKYGKKIWQPEEVSFTVKENNDSDSPLYGKRVIMIDDQPLAPVAQDSATLPVGSTGTAYLYTQPGAKIIATSAKGNHLTMKRAKHYSPQQWQGETEELVLERLSENEKHTWVLSYEGEPVGELDKSSIASLKKHHILKEGKTLSLTLESSPPTSALLQLIPDTLQYHKQAKEAVAKGWISRLEEERQNQNQMKRG